MQIPFDSTLNKYNKGINCQINSHILHARNYVNLIWQKYCIRHSSHKCSDYLIGSGLLHCHPPGSQSIKMYQVGDRTEITTLFSLRFFNFWGSMNLSFPHRIQYSFWLMIVDEWFHFHLPFTSTIPLSCWTLLHIKLSFSQWVLGLRTGQGEKFGRALFFRWLPSASLISSQWIN